MSDQTGEFTVSTNGAYGVVSETQGVGQICVTNTSLTTLPQSIVEVQVDGNSTWHPALGTEGYGFQLNVGQSANIRAMQNGQEAASCMVMTGSSETEVSFQFDWDSTSGFASVTAEAEETDIVVE